MGYQFKGGNSGGKRVSDTVSAGSEDWDEKAQALIPKNVRQKSKHKVNDMLTSGVQRTGMFERRYTSNMLIFK